MKDSMMFVLLGIVCLSILFPISMAVWALNNYSTYIEHNDKCQLLAEHLPPSDQLGFNFSKAQDNPTVQKYQKECF